MCGINGLVSFNQFENTKSLIKKMNNSIIHRGPDSEGEYYNNNFNYSLGLGMRRLSIIDLNKGSQPIFSEDFTKVIVFNGEIYNYNVLKHDLIKKGSKFYTDSDTEVILKLYESEGLESFWKLDGMFTFCIYDKSIDKVYIARDYFGEKPMFYSINQNEFIWASELKSIISVLDSKPVIDPNGLALYFQLTYIPAPYTIYKGIHKLQANHFIEFDCNSKSFSISEMKRPVKEFKFQTKKEATKLTHDLVQNSVLNRSISDVPLGAFLSGGVDSSIVSLCLAQQQNKKIDTFSVVFDKKEFDESYKSRIVAKKINSNHHEFKISEKELPKYINEIILNFDEPFADSSALATYLLSKKTKEYVKVALTGDGGDEVFSGYNKHLIGQLNTKYISIIPQFIHKKILKLAEHILTSKDDKRALKFKINRLLNSISYDDSFYFKIISLGFQENEMNNLFSLKMNSSVFDFFKQSKSRSSLLDFREIDRLISLEGDMLVKVDRSSMYASLECRSPFLNKDLWDFANQLPEEYLINNWDKKHILKEAFKEYFPHNFLNLSKKGFGVPVGDWMRDVLKEEIILYINKDLIQRQNIFNYEYIFDLVMNHLYSRKDNTFRVWTFYCFQKWWVSNFLIDEK